MKLVVSRAAVVDLVRLRTFLTGKNEVAAQRAVQVLDQAMKSLLDLPDRGRPIGTSGARDLIVPFGKSTYLVRYVHRPETDEIVVLRMWHGRETREMSDPHLTVWYNTRCPVCDAGIDRQRNKLLAAVQAGTIAFRDINLEPDALAGHGASLEDIRRRLHATDADGRLMVGADVAFAVWRLTPGEGWLATVFGNPVMRPIARFVYDRFADLLYAWNRRKGHW